MALSAELREALGISDLLGELKQIKAELKRLTLEDKRIWFDLRSACAYKGCNYNSVKSKKEQQPSGGIADAIINGRRYWNRETIEAWIYQTDGEAS